MVSEGFTNLVIAGMPIVRAITALPAAEFVSPLSPVERDEDEGEDEEGEGDTKPPPAASPFSSHLQVSDGGLYCPGGSSQSSPARMRLYSCLDALS